MRGFVGVVNLHAGDHTRGQRGAAHVYAAGCPADANTTSWFGVPVMTVERAIVDLARHNRRDGLMAADAALHEQLTTSARLEATLQTAVRWPGVRAAHRGRRPGKIHV